MENQTFNYKDDRFSIRPQAPPGGQSHFSLSDSGYGDRDIYHPHKRNNHPNNDINPPSNNTKKDNVNENTINGAAPVTGSRPSIKLRAPPGGKSSLDYYSEDNYEPVHSKNEPENDIKTEPQNEQDNKNNNSSGSYYNSNIGKSKYRPVYTPQAPPGGKSSISFGYDEPDTKPNPKPKPNPEFQESSAKVQPTTTPGRRMNNQLSSSIFNTEEENKPYKPYYAPQAPPGGKDSISIGFSTNEKPKQNNQSTYNKSSISYEEENKPYKPYYAPQAPPGGKDSISIGLSTPEKPKQNNQSTYNKSNISYEEENKPYKPYYAPQAPPGGKDSISLGSSEPVDTNTTFSGRRRNYKNDHFRSSFSFNY